MKISVFLLVLFFIIGFSIGLPQKAPSQASFLENHVSRKIGKIRFPGDEPDEADEADEPDANVNTVANLTLPTPVCKGDTFCVDPPNYPTAEVEIALRMNSKVVKYFANSDMDPEVTNKALKRKENVETLCQSYETIIYPKAAESINNEFMFVVNQANFLQGVRIERCNPGVEDTSCSYLGELESWYTTTCKQKFIYRQLVAVSSMGEVKPELFRFPASCCCHIKRDANYFQVRMSQKRGKKARRHDAEEE
ncbi:protein spaetzle [Nasonia vitripennis]|uniref:Spaetzle domain-containing protein n=1 Tax=Nasonia vitripennis TaxID=7425 RepID=A0A7M7GE82_NASVI|nr:protein spaetzle [Nasonia vitripennis]